MVSRRSVSHNHIYHYSYNVNPGSHLSWESEMVSFDWCYWVNAIYRYIPLQNPRFVPYFSLLVTHSHTPEGENRRFLRQVRTRILSPVNTCHKDRGFCPSDIRKLVSHKPKYGTNLGLLLQRYTVTYSSRSITSARRSHLWFLRQVWVRLKKNNNFYAEFSSCY